MVTVAGPHRSRQHPQCFCAGTADAVPNQVQRAEYNMREHAVAQVVMPANALAVGEKVLVQPMQQLLKNVLKLVSKVQRPVSMSWL